ncbi:MAG TPA: CDP-alcohol phosphatidyltransferase family protein [Rhizomicrobium sp.]|nr:CDP-alcohol phosphatidyltransferase family protein [Rhizomicrobium sp.]
MKAVLRQAPNILSGLRLVAAPIAGWLIYHGVDWAALCVFGFAGLSDAADGYLAKTFGLSSRFGAWLDPAADKLLMLVSFVTLTVVGAVPLWLSVLVIGRDAAIVVGVAFAKALGAPLEVKPLIVGKASTVIQVLYVAMMLLLLALDVYEPMLEMAGDMAVAAITLASFLAYAYVWLMAVAVRSRAA